MSDNTQAGDEGFESTGRLNKTLRLLSDVEMIQVMRRLLFIITVTIADRSHFSSGREQFHKTPAAATAACVHSGDTIAPGRLFQPFPHATLVLAYLG